MMMLSWQNVADYVARGIPFRQPLGGTRGALLVFDGSAGRMEVQLPCEESEDLPRIMLAHLSAGRQAVAGRTFMVLSGDGLDNLQPMHQLAVLCATFFEVAGVTASAAFRAGLSAWSQLLEGKPLLSAESQLGLRGELALLQRLVVSRGPRAVRSWTAYDELVPGRHDFRVERFEIEVKATRGKSRTHWISSLQQLASSPDLRLHLLSLQFEPAGLATGQTLPECVGKVRSLLDTSPEDRERFDQCLSLAYYRHEDADHYDERLHLASDPTLIPVDDSLPALTVAVLSSSIPPHALQRLRDLKYQIDCDGLGCGPRGEPFLRIVGPWNNC